MAKERVKVEGVTMQQMKALFEFARERGCTVHLPSTGISTPVQSVDFEEDVAYMHVLPNVHLRWRPGAPIDIQIKRESSDT